MSRDPTVEWPDERLRSEIEEKIDKLEQAIRRHESAKFIPGDAGRSKENKAHDWVMTIRDHLIEWTYNKITDNE